MFSIYEAVVRTIDSTFRAAAVAPMVVAITEDGVDGVIDYIHLDEENATNASPENLPVLLTWWVFEHARGYEVISATLSRRRT